MRTARLSAPTLNTLSGSAPSPDPIRPNSGSVDIPRTICKHPDTLKGRLTVNTLYVVGLGANLGSRWASLKSAIRLLSATPGCAVTAVSDFVHSAPVGPAQPGYLNGAVRLVSSLSPPELLARLASIEAELGRVRAERWGPRVIDLDILWARTPSSTPELTIPHPRLLERAFALGPLLQVAPWLKGQLGAALEPLPACPKAGAPRIERCLQGDTLRVSVRADSRAEALAGSLGALAEFLPPFEGELSTRVIDCQCSRGDEPRAYIEAALSAAKAGQRLLLASVCDLMAGRVTGRLVGASGAVPGLSLLRVDETEAAHGVTLGLAFSVQIPDR